jgi:hypothetical protein
VSVIPVQAGRIRASGETLCKNFLAELMPNRKRFAVVRRQTVNLPCAPTLFAGNRLFTKIKGRKTAQIGCGNLARLDKLHRTFAGLSSGLHQTKNRQ